MGILDDAIREHLELKRQRGGDPDELARAEQEALGPVRRERFESQEAEQGTRMALPGRRRARAADLEHEGAGDELGVADDGGDLRLRDGDAHDGLSEAEYEEYYEEEYYDEEEGDWEEPYGEAPEQTGSGAPRGRVPPEAAPPTQAVLRDSIEPVSEGEQTVEYSVEDAVRSAPETPRGDEPEPQGPESEGDDMLEETPEFLQDAPEHDRLWFEQRPPRDFDFDG